MSDRYLLAKRQAWVCRALAALFLVAAALNLMMVMVPIAIGAAPGLEAHCVQAVCDTVNRPEALLPAEWTAEVAAPGPAARFRAWTARPSVRAGLTAIGLAAGLPFVLLMASVAAALWCLGGRQPDPLTRALPWLRVATAAALAIALAPPLAGSGRAMLLAPGTPEGAVWYAAVDLGPFLLGLLLAFAAMAVTWALAAGARAGRELAGFV